MALAPGLRGEAREALLYVEGVRKTFGSGSPLGSRGRAKVHALDGVSLDVRRGEVVGVVGESGSGKSTLARCIVRLARQDAGRSLFDGIDLASVSGRELRRLRRRLQCAFQDPFGSLDPRYTVDDLVSEPLVIHGVPKRERGSKVGESLDLVGISRTVVRRKPHQFSGGQRQRIALARSLVLRPDLLILDEPVSALDVSIQAQILNLLADLRDELQLTYVLIVHDLLVAEYFCDRVAVVYAGRVMELGPGQALFSRPLHPYTASLLAAAPVPEPKRARIQLQAGSHLDSGIEERPLDGCPFRPRCGIGRDREQCATVVPPLREHLAGHWAACHYTDELAREAAPIVAAAAGSPEEAIA